MFKVKKKMKRLFPLTFLFAIYVCTYHLVESQQSQSSGNKISEMMNDLNEISRSKMITDKLKRKNHLMLFTNYYQFKQKCPIEI